MLDDLARFEERTHRLESRFAGIVGGLHESLEALVQCEAFTYATRPRVLPQSVVYLFAEGDDALYVGRSNAFAQRLGNHCGTASQANQSALAFKLAREAAGITQASYSGPNTRANLMKDTVFRVRFEQAKTRLRAMDIRYVKETDQVRQAILEIYCAVALRTQYNDWHTS